MIDTTMILVIAKILLIAYTISRFEPLKMILELLPDKLFWNFLNLALTCSKCLSFWVGITIFGDIWSAMLASLIMTVLEKVLFSWLERVTLN